jgi:hypothetical protein
MKQDLATAMTSGYAVIINTNNVTIDCNNFKLGGLAAGLGTFTEGVFAQNRANIAVRHCNIRGFYVGVELSGTTGSGHTVEDNRLDGNTFMGIKVEGDGSVIRRNRVFDTGLTTTTNYVYAMFATGTVDVLDNTIGNATATGNGYAYGIYLNSNIDGNVQGNMVRGLLPSGTGEAKAIYSGSSTRLSIDDNKLIGDASTGSTGIVCNTSQDRAKNNVINGFATAMTDCGDAGGNDVTP